MKKIATLLLAAGLTLTACAPGGPSAAVSAEPVNSSSIAEATESTSPTPTPTPSLKIYKLNEPANHDGLVIQVKQAKISRTLLMNTSQYRPETDMATFEEVPAKAGASYMILTTRVTNNTKKGLDLTCGGPVQITVYNDQEQEYTPVEDLYQIKGNPECNSQLGPGFSAPMTWAFLVPTGSKMIAAGFYNINDFDAVNREPTFIALDPNYK